MEGSLLGDNLCHLREFVVIFFPSWGGFLGAGTGPRGGREASRGNLAAAVPRHSLDRLNMSNDSLKKKKDSVGIEYAILENAGDFNWDTAYRKDPVFRSIYKRISMSGVPHEGYEIWPDGTMSFETSKGPHACILAALLREVLHIAHDSLGHMGYKKTYSHITSSFYRPRLSTYVEQYISGCPKCSVNKTSRTKLLGSLLPIDIPDGKGALGAFEYVGMDFIVSLPKSREFNAIMVVIDKLMRYGIFIPTTSDYIALSTANLFVE